MRKCFIFVTELLIWNLLLLKIEDHTDFGIWLVADNIDILRRIHHGHAGIVKTNHGKLYILTNTAPSTMRIHKGWKQNNDRRKLLLTTASGGLFMLKFSGKPLNKKKK